LFSAGSFTNWLPYLLGVLGIFTVVTMFAVVVTRQRANEAGLRPIDVALLSAKTNQSVDDLLKLIDKHRGNRDVYVVGVTNVGKSTLINQIVRQNTGVKDLITTSRFPGTTLDKIELPNSRDIFYCGVV